MAHGGAVQPPVPRRTIGSSSLGSLARHLSTSLSYRMLPWPEQHA